MTQQDAILILHAISTTMMAGLIWFVQIVHYPMFANVSPQAFQRYETIHQRRTSLVVIPLMLAELATSILLLLRPSPEAPRALPLAGLLLLALIWISTFLVQVPIHRRLEAGHDERLIRRLTKTNWLRTILWSARSLLAVYLLWLG